MAQRVQLDLSQRGLNCLVISGVSVMKMRGMVTAKTVDERTMPAIPGRASPLQFGPTTV